MWVRMTHSFEAAKAAFLTQTKYSAGDLWFSYQTTKRPLRERRLPERQLTCRFTRCSKARGCEPKKPRQQARGPHPWARVYKSPGAWSGIHSSGNFKETLPPSLCHHVFQLLHKKLLFQASRRTVHRPSRSSRHSFSPRCRLPEWHLLAQFLPNWFLAPGPLSGVMLWAHGLPANMLPENFLYLHPCPGNLQSTDYLCLQSLLNSL